MTDANRPTNTQEAITAQLNSVRVWDVLSGMLMRDRALAALAARAKAARILQGYYADQKDKDILSAARTQAILNERANRGR